MIGLYKRAAGYHLNKWGGVWRGSSWIQFKGYWFYQNNAGFNQQSIESHLSKVKELNPKKIHPLKNH